MNAVQMWEMLLTTSDVFGAMNDPAVNIYRQAQGFCSMGISDGPTKVVHFSNSRDVCVAVRTGAGLNCFQVEYYGSTPLEIQSPQCPLHINRVSNLEDLARVMSGGVRYPGCSI